jgi:hypothetical protein
MKVRVVIEVDVDDNPKHSNQVNAANAAIHVYQTIKDTFAHVDILEVNNV